MLSVDSINACLPQTQCQRCSYPCCNDYAVAISNGEANINQCPPGGDVTIKKLAELSGQTVLALDPQFGDFQPKTLAFIIEQRCIGCVLCIKACPVDAIVGANKLMHSVIQAHCTGCELCIPVCPTDCIEMHALNHAALPASDWPGYTPNDITSGRIRHDNRQIRLVKMATAKAKATPAMLDQDRRKQAILDAVNRKLKDRGAK